MLETLESLYLKIFLLWPFFIINSADSTKLYRDIPPSLLSYLLTQYLINGVTKKIIIMISWLSFATSNGTKTNDWTITYI